MAKPLSNSNVSLSIPGSLQNQYEAYEKDSETITVQENPHNFTLHDLVVFFGPLDRLPAWVEIGRFYGIPAIEGRGLKIGIDRPGEELDPSASPRLLDPGTVGSVRSFLARRFPALADAPLVDSRVCTYELTPDEHLLVDRHPRHENVILLGGGSGHGYKLAPVLGGYVADMATGVRRDTEPRFRLGPRTPRGWREP